MEREGSGVGGAPSVHPVLLRADDYRRSIAGGMEMECRTFTFCIHQDRCCCQDNSSTMLIFGTVFEHVFEQARPWVRCAIAICLELCA